MPTVVFVREELEELDRATGEGGRRGEGGGAKSRASSLFEFVSILALSHSGHNRAQRASAEGLPNLLAQRAWAGTSVLSLGRAS